MASPKTHTAPNQVTVRIVLGAGHRAMHVCVVSRDRQVLAYYPAEWTNNRIPSISEVQRDARWQAAAASTIPAGV